MMHPDNEQVRQYEHRQATRASLATQETATALEGSPSMEETQYPLRPDPMNQHWPWLKWQDKAETPTAYGGGLYLQEKVSPARILSTLLKDPAALQKNWFADFNNLPQDAHLEPYVHQGGKWSNRLIRGASQRVMCSLLEKEGLKSQVDLVYMDPPYNINFKSNFQLRAYQTEVEEDWDNIPKQPREINVFRDTYRNGAHSYLSQLRVNAMLAKDLLKESGSFVLQIGPDNLHYAACLLDEVFGHENHVATIPYRTTTNPGTTLLPEVGNWLIWYAKDVTKTKYHQMYEPANTREEIIKKLTNFAKLQEPNGSIRSLTDQEKENIEKIPQHVRILTTYPAFAMAPSTSGRSDKFFLHPEGKPCNNKRWSQADREEAKTKPHEDHVCKKDCNQPLPDNWEEHKCSPKCHTTAGTRLCPIGRRCGPKCHANAYRCPPGKQWRVSLKGLHAIAYQPNRMHIRRNRKHPMENRYSINGYTLDELEYSQDFGINAIWQNAGHVTNKRYVVETPPTVLEKVISLMTTNPRRPNPGPNLRLRSDALPRRTLGPPLDRHRRLRCIHRSSPGKTGNCHPSLPPPQGFTRRPSSRPRTRRIPETKARPDSFPAQAEIQLRSQHGLRQ